MADPFFNKRRHFGLRQHGSATEAANEPVLGFGTDLAIIKKHFGVYKPRLSCAQCPGVSGREEEGTDALGHVLGREQQAAVPAAAGTACTPAPTPTGGLKSAQTIHWCPLSFSTSHAGYFSPTHLPLHLLRLSHSLTSLGINSLRDLCNPQILVLILPCAHSAQDP